MRLAISDANIFIDLFEIGLINHFFQLSLSYHTTDLVMNELDFSEQLILKPYIENGSLTVQKMNIQEIDELKTEVIISKKLSRSDISIYAYAKKINAMLLTSDKPLRKEAEAMGFEVHGILWLFDKLIEHEIITKTIAAKKMKELMLANTRLPKDACLKRIENWML
jgi:predicted nucleic acid-binding protein